MTAARRICQPSVRAPEPVGVLMTRSTSPRSIQSTTCGEPSPILLSACARHAHALDRGGGAARGEDAKAVVVRIWAIAKAPSLSESVTEMNAVPAQRQRRAGGGLRLGEGGREVARDAHHLAGGAHLGPEHGVGALEAVEGQHGLLDGDVVAEAEPFALAGQPERGDAARRA